MPDDAFEMIDILFLWSHDPVRALVLVHDSTASLCVRGLQRLQTFDRLHALARAYVDPKGETNNHSLPNRELLTRFLRSPNWMTFRSACRVFLSLGSPSNVGHRESERSASVEELAHQ